MLNKLILEKHDSIGLYIHIPFCHRKCSYCDFFSIPYKKKGGSIHNSYLLTVIEHLKIFLVETGFPSVSTIYIGGGTPSSVDVKSMDLFLSTLEKIINRETVSEFTMEVNPEDVNKEFLSMLESHTVNRLSMGVQSLDPSVIKTLGRNTDKQRTLYALDCVGKYWDRDKSFDLINCVPGQRQSSALEDIRMAASFSPEHLSLYNLTFEEGTPLYNNLTKGLYKKNEKEEFTVYAKSVDLLESLGFKRYEISNFAHNGKESIHNKGYWKMLPYLGIGPGAASTLKSKAHPLRIEYERNIERFILNEIDKSIKFEKISDSSFLLEHLMMGLRMIKGVNIAEINSIFSIDLLSSLKQTLDKWSKKIEVTGGMLCLSTSGLNFLNSFLLDTAVELEKVNINSCLWPRNGGWKLLREETCK